MSKQQATMKELLITDSALIEKYKNEIRTMGVYIPPQRDETTLDMEAMKAGSHAKSIEMIGQQSPISITINEDDPDKESKDSIFRMHRRLADGNHRWLETQSKGLVPVDVLDIKFYKVKNFEEYTKLKTLLDMKKADNPAEKKLDIESLCEAIFKEGTPMEKVSSKVKKILDGIIPESTINEFIPEKFKEKSKQREKQKVPEKTDEKGPTKHEEDMQKMVEEVTRLTKEVSTLTKQKEELGKELKETHDILSIVKLEKTVPVQGLDNVSVAVYFDVGKKEFLVRKA